MHATNLANAMRHSGPPGASVGLPYNLSSGSLALGQGSGGAGAGAGPPAFHQPPYAPQQHSNPFGNFGNATAAASASAGLNVLQQLQLQQQRLAGQGAGGQGTGGAAGGAVDPSASAAAPFKLTLNLAALQNQFNPLAWHAQMQQQQLLGLSGLGGFPGPGGFPGAPGTAGAPGQAPTQQQAQVQARTQAQAQGQPSHYPQQPQPQPHAQAARHAQPQGRPTMPVGAAAAPQPGADAHGLPAALEGQNIIAAKQLTQYDIRSGRIVLPRSGVELYLPAAVQQPVFDVLLVIDTVAQGGAGPRVEASRFESCIKSWCVSESDICIELDINLRP